MPWIIVKFTKTDEIEAILLCWYMENAGLVFYPNYEKNRVKKSIKNQENPGHDWELFEVTLLRPQPFDDFKVACAKATKCCENSEATENEELPNKRTLKKKHTFGFESDSDSNHSSESSLNLRESQSGAASEHKMAHGNKKGIGYTGTFKHKKSVQQSQENSSCSSSKIDVPLVAHDKGDKEFKIEVIKLLTKIQKRMGDIETKMDSISVQLDNLKDSVIRVNENMEERPHVEENTLSMIPVNSLEGLRELEDLIKNKNIYDIMVQHMVRIGGRDYKECLRRFMKRIINDNVAIEFSLCGHKKKKTFSNLTIFSAVTDAVQKCFNTTTNKEIELVAGQWLAKAPERLKKSGPVIRLFEK